MAETWLPGVVKKSIPQTSTDPDIIPVGPIFHVAVSEADSLHDFFERDGGIESHGYIRRDGTIEQYRPVTVECDAQNAGNSWISHGKRYGFTSWETQGMGSGEWTPEQVASIKFIIGWHHDEWDVPLRKCPAWNAPGVGYHCLFEEWNTNHHSCPGPDRVKQFEHTIVLWMHQGGDEDDMTPEQEDRLVRKIADAVRAVPVKNKDAAGDVQGVGNLASILTNIESSADANHKAQMSLLREIRDLLKKG